MPDSQTLGYIGFVVAAAAAILCFWDARKGKLSSIGKGLIVLAVLGAITGIVGSVLSSKEARTKERIMREWALVMEEPVTTLSFEQYLMIGEVRVSELEKMLDSQKLMFGLPEPGGLVLDYSDFKIFSVSFRSKYLDKEKGSTIEAFVRVYDYGSSDLLALEEVSLHKLEILPRWIAAYEPENHRWEKSDYTCGISFSLPWEKIGLSDIRIVKDLRKLAFIFKPAAEGFTVKYKRVDDRELKYFNIRIKIHSSSFIFCLDPLLVGYEISVDDKTGVRHLEASISHDELLTFFYEQFVNEGGLHSDDRSLYHRPKQRYTGKVTYVSPIYAILALRDDSNSKFDVKYGLCWKWIRRLFKVAYTFI